MTSNTPNGKKAGIKSRGENGLGKVKEWEEYVEPG